MAEHLASILDKGDVIVIDAKHPLWTAWDDDDWNGATAGNWVAQYIKPGVRVLLCPPGKDTLFGRALRRNQVIIRMKASFERLGAFVRMEKKS